jgi:4-aminobutyrate aminotransferase-like enzyme/Ser/Thr protein kinase RdoA (MazF antagonist)
MESMDGPPTDLPPRPDVGPELAAAIAETCFGVRVGEVVELPSERDRNFRLSHDGVPRYVLKVAGPDETRALLAAQNAAMFHLATRLEGLAVPLPERAPDGALIAEAGDASGTLRLVRLLTWLPGTPLAELDREGDDPVLATSLGEAAGQVAAALADFAQPALGRAFRWDVAGAPAIVRHHRDEVADTDRRALLDDWMARLAPTYAALGDLPRGVVHNDANDHNVLVAGSRVTGLLDFGDMVHSVQVAEAAVPVAYAMFEARQPLVAAERIVAGFHARRPLTGPELAALFPLVIARLCLSVALAVHQRRLQPDNAYLAISEAGAWQTLERLEAVSLGEVHRRLAAACGLPLPPAAARAQRSGRSLDQAIAARRGLLGPSLSLSYRQPLKIVLGRGAYLFDDEGRRYLDGVNNVCHVGHAHPRVVAAATRQMSRLNTNTRYLHDRVLDYAERLTATLPDALEVCFFVNSGSEANELALRLARTYTGRQDILVLDGAYHGNTGQLVEISPYKFAGPGGAGRPAHVHVAPLPDVYRGPHPREGGDPAAWYAERLRETIAAATSEGRQMAAFFAESLPGSAGQIVPPPGYLRAAYGHARAAGAVVVADEVQVGFGRVGERFWGFQLDAGAVPDIVTMGKPIGNGHPIGAVVTTRAIADAFANGMEFFSTFGGNPVSAAVGLAVLDVMRDEGLQERALTVGGYLAARLRELAAEWPTLGDVRGAGLCLGLELVRDRSTLEPAAEEAANVVEVARDEGVLLSTDGPLHNVIKIKPPLVFGEREADRLVAALRSDPRR